MLPSYLPRSTRIYVIVLYLVCARATLYVPAKSLISTIFFHSSVKYFSNYTSFASVRQQWWSMGSHWIVSWLECEVKTVDTSINCGLGSANKPLKGVSQFLHSILSWYETWKMIPLSSFLDIVTRENGTVWSVIPMSCWILMIYFLLNPNFVLVRCRDCNRISKLPLIIRLILQEKSAVFKRYKVNQLYWSLFGDQVQGKSSCIKGSSEQGRLRDISKYSWFCKVKSAAFAVVQRSIYNPCLEYAPSEERLAPRNSPRGW